MENERSLRCLWQNTAALLRAIPAGQTKCYGAIAAGLGRPGAALSVAQANGALIGYGGGLWRKRRLLKIER